MDNLRLWPVAQIANGANTSSDVAFLCPPSRLGANLVALCLFLVCSRSVYPLNPSTLIAQYGHHVWRVGENGLESSPNVIAQTMDGISGLAQLTVSFDSTAFTSLAGLRPLENDCPGRMSKRCLALETAAYT